MKKTLHVIFMLSILAFIPACKLAVIVVEGGEVQSDVSGTCAAGTVCLVEVEDTNFEDAFVPVPFEGWYFDSWNAGHKFLCGNSLDPVCTLSFSGFEEKFEDIVASSETFYLMPIFMPIEPDSVVVEGRTIVAAAKEWLQPADFVGFSYDQVSEACPEGICSGSLSWSTIDLKGYRWASDDDVRLLFQAYRKAGRSVNQDFDPTRLATDVGDHLVAMLSNQSSVVVIGDGYDPLVEIHIFIREGMGDGPWFWRHVE